MPKKRIKSKQGGSGKLTNIRLYYLLGGECIASIFADAIDMFPSDEARRQAWEENKEHLFYYEVAEDRLQERAAYTRAPAWWDYEAPEPIGEEETEKEYLIRLNLVTDWDRKRELEPLRHLTEEEQRDTVKDFIKTIKHYKGMLELIYGYYLKGEKPMHGNSEWPEYSKGYAERAAFLEKHAAGGNAAAEAWKQALEEVKAYYEQKEAREEAGGNAKKTG